MGALILVGFIGLRFRVGADWPTYLRFFDYMSAVDLFKAMAMTDPLYGAINWSVEQAGGKIWTVNLVCATIFTYGLVSFSRWQPNPPLAMLV
ncbi:MAG TPA: EpsG family protein, partial [Candidatus Udaeobacter sp.]|nr:EpsG family protein [Candidatus Udaeobacter sp.]